MLHNIYYNKRSIRTFMIIKYNIINLTLCLKPQLNYPCTYLINNNNNNFCRQNIFKYLCFILKVGTLYTV